DDDELRLLRELRDEGREPSDVGVVERRIDLVEHAERTRPVPEDRNQQRESGQRLFASREQEHVLQSLARGLRNDVDAALQHVALVQEPQVALAAPEQDLEYVDKILPDLRECVLKLLDRAPVDVGDRLLRIGDRLLDVGALPLQELMTLVELLILLEGA